MPEANSAPSIVLTSPSDGEIVDEGTPVLLAAEVSDDHDAVSALSLSWESDLDGDLGTEPSVTTDALGVGTHAITLTARDSAGLESTASANLRVNGLPSAPVVSLSTVGTAEDLVASVDTESVDPDGDTVEYAYAWSLDGEAQVEHTGSSVPASATAKGDLWEVEVTPSDGHGQGPSATVSTVIANTAPAIASVTLPATAYTDDVLAVTVDATDVDNDALAYTYTWTVGTTHRGVDAPSLDGADHFDKGDTVTVTVVASDGEAQSSAETSDPAAILNSPPSSPELSISPADPVAGIDDLVCAVEVAATDPDADGISYAFTWYEDGVEFNGTPLTSTWVGDTVAAGDTWDGIGWECEVVATDDDDTPASAPPATATTTPEGCIVTVRWEVDGALVHEVHVPETDVYPTTTWIMLQVWGNQPSVTADGQIRALYVTSLADGSVLLSGDSEDDPGDGLCRGDWATSGGACCGDTKVESCVAQGQSDWNEFRQIATGVPMDDGVRVEFETRVSSGTDHISVVLETDTTAETAGNSTSNDYVFARSGDNHTAGFQVLPDGTGDVVDHDWILPDCCLDDCAGDTSCEEWHALALEVDPSPSCTAP